MSHNAARISATPGGRRWVRALADARQLMDAGHLVAAEAAYRAIATEVLQSGSRSRALVSMALRHWENCQKALGWTISAKQTRALAERVLLRMDTCGPVTVTVDPERLLERVAARCAFTHSLVLPAPPHWNKTAQPGMANLRQQFKFGSADPVWLEISLLAWSAPEASTPQSFVCTVLLPWLFETPEQQDRALRLVNQMNLDAGGATVLLLPETGRIAIRSCHHFAGPDGVAEHDVAAHLAEAHHEAAVAAGCCALSLAWSWSRKVANLHRQVRQAPPSSRRT